MQTEFKITRRSHELFSNYFDNYTLDQVNKIPTGHNNNLIWNIGHILVSQQTLVYKGANQQPLVAEDLIARYMRGTKPERDVTQAEADEIRDLLLTLIIKTEEDYNAGLFTEYNARKSEMGFDLSSVEDAIAFNNHHEGIHLGIMMQLRKLV
jgi:hypothetical protein